MIDQPFYPRNRKEFVVLEVGDVFLDRKFFGIARIVRDFIKEELFL